MKDIDVEFGGEIKIGPIEYSKILTRVVTKNNDSSGKITVPREHINHKVLVLFPKEVNKK